MIRITAIDSAGLTKTKEFFVEITTAEKPDGFLVNVEKEPPEGGLVAGAGFYKNGESVTLRTTSNSGFLSPDTSAMSREVSLRPTPKVQSGRRKEYLNQFHTQGYHMVLVDVTPDRHGYAWGGGMVQHGNEITVQAKELDEKHGCVFSHWSINGMPQEVDESNPLVLKLTVDHTLRHFGPLRLRAARFDETGAFRNFFAGGLPLPW